ncbi:hypothetical protein GW17_00028181 [Ensete ventricosum]|nr:hypothetical protein GW17_00028181 [Ensete ventricosum]RZR94887.1 hypothetical protein BHM03_00023653 [Ensete ventricosum]
MKDAPRRLNAGDRTRFAQATDPGNTSKISQPFVSTLGKESLGKSIPTPRPYARRPYVLRRRSQWLLP